jgi:Concanavalin A-like lectin/glucanases superfamily/Bacterial Ig-like domain (group 2)
MLKRYQFAVAVLSIVLILSCGVMAQVAGQNINMVSGTEFPAGDPFLQRQNEPSIAVSSRNSQHLLGGANDYRTVDIADPGATDELGDAWLSVFTSTDGGDTWKSTLMPGYPQDQSAVGKSSPLHAYTAATDPTIRAGSHGLFYYSGLVFNRGSNAPSGVFVSVFQDQNNKGNGSGAIQTTGGATGNPFLYISANLVDSGTSGQFLDKPWIVVDIPRPNHIATCSINGATIQSGYVYLFYTKFSGSKNNPSSQIKETYSKDCGKTWVNPQTMSQSSKYNQGTVAAIDPANGNIWVAWRQLSLGNKQQPDAMMVASSTDGGYSYIVGTGPAYTFPTGATFDQNASSSSFRTIDVPALAVDNKSRVWLAFSQRATGPGSTGASRIMVMTRGAGSSTWSAPYQADSTSPLSTRPGGPPAVYGHQFMPSFSYAYGKLMLAWYDTRWDNQQIIVNCTPNSSQTPSCVQTHVPIPGSPLASNPPNYGAVFTAQVFDPQGGVRHTVDVFGALIDPLQFGLSVPAVQISQYPFFINVPNPSNPNTPPVIQQAAFNPPNLPEFVKGSVAFIGDYIDVAGQTMVPNGTGWKFTDNSIAPVFHAAWTDNRDVVPPPYVNSVQDWSKFSPPGSNTGNKSIYNPLANQANCAVGYSGDRNENVYTSRITSGLVIGFRENHKPITTSDLKRSFSLYVRNTNNPLINPGPAYYRILLGTTSTNNVCSNNGTNGTASFANAPGCFVDVAVLPNTSVAQTIEVKANSSANGVVGVNVLVAQISAPPNSNFNGGQQATAFINGDSTNPGVTNPDPTQADTLNPDATNLYSNLPNLSQGESYDPTVTGAGITPYQCDPSNLNSCQGVNIIASPSIASPSIASPSIASPSIASPSIASPSIASPSIASPSIVAVTTASPSIVNPTVASPSIASPSIASPSIVNFATASPSITNLGDNTVVTDYSWKLNNKGNTSSSYNTQQFIRQASTFCGQGAATRCQLIAHKTYASPTVGLVNGQASCELAVAVADITQANIPDPAFTTAQGLLGTSSPTALDASSATISLAPGEGTRLTLRVFGTATNPIPFITGTNIFPITPIASANTADTGQTTPPQSLTILTAVLPVAIVGQPYTRDGSATGTQVALQSLGGVFPIISNVQTTPVWSLTSESSALPSPLTLATSGKISTDAVTAAPGTYTFSPQVQDFATPTKNLDAQLINIQVNSFFISSVDVVTTHNQNISQVGATQYMQAGDSATITAVVSSQGPADASNVLAALSYSAVAAGSTNVVAPVLSCFANDTHTPNPNPQAIMATGAVTFTFTCNAVSGNGYVNFKVNATAKYVNGVATVTGVAAPVTEPLSISNTTPNLVVDTVKPTLSFSATPTVPSAPGWFNTAVVVPYTTNDNLAGVSTALATSPATANGTTNAFNGTGAMTLNTEGNAVTGDMTVTDFALNVFSTTSGSFKIDRTQPTITGAPDRPANGYGWYNAPVTVTFTCNDPNPANGPVGQQSGIKSVGGCTAAIPLAAEGAGQSASGTAVDNANNSQGTLVTPINIDLTKPTATNFVPTPAVPTSGWYNATTPTVSFAYLAADALSGVDGLQTTATPVLVSGEGSSVTKPVVVTDKAGNILTTTTTPVKIDLTKPTLTPGALNADNSPYAANTWTNQTVTVTVTCADSLSGVGSLNLNTTGSGGSPAITAVNTTTATVTISSDTPGLTVGGTCSDVAGNTQITSFGPVMIDKTPPSISSSAVPTANGNNWNNSSVTVTFSCTDVGGSGVASFTPPAVVTTQGAAQNVPGTCTDIAGNSSSTSAVVNLDITNPTVLITVPAEGGTYAINQSITANYSCVDGLSGFQSCVATPSVASGSGFSQSTAGSYTFTVQGIDKAGNSTPATTHYTVAPYTFTGFQAPLSNAGTTAAPTASGSFVQGTVIPMAWQLTLAGNPVTDTTTLASITTYPNATCTGVPGGSGTALDILALGYDTPNSRFLYNWDTSTVTAGCYYVVVAFTDGTSYATNINIAPANTIVNALQFTGADYIDGTNSNLPQNNAPRTIEAWINPSTAGAGTIFDFGGALNRSALVNANHRIHFVTEQGDIGGTVDIPIGQWTHVAVSFDGTTASLYVNGQLDVATPAAGTLATTGSAWRIGADLGTGASQFAGKIDELKVWSTARSAAEINTLNNELCTGTAGLVAYYKFNQGAAGGNNPTITTLVDSSASNADGSLTGFGLTGATSNWVTGSAPAYANQLQSIAIAPVAATIIAGGTQQFTATGSCSDNSTLDLTGTAMWSSSDPTKATIDGSGVATGIAAGTSSINGKSAGVSGTAATLTVQ